jgi:type IV pilus assembly protein PilB
MALSEATYHQILVESGLLSEEDFARVREVANSSGRPMETALVDLGFYSDEQAGKLMADAYGVRFVNLSRVKLDAKAVQVVPDIVVKKQGVLGYGWAGERLQAATVDPQNLELVSFLEKKTGYPVDAGYTTWGMLDDAMRSYTQDLVSRVQGLAKQFEDLRQSDTTDRGGTGEELVVQIVDLIMQYGYNNGSSDVHIEPQERQSLVRYRVDGILHDVFKFARSLHDVITARIKILSNLRTDEHFAAQDGKFRMRIDNEMVDVRVSVMPVIEGEKIVMRILSEKGRTFTLETLGFSPGDLKRVRAAAAKPYGMLLATGPTGCGKTTSMYAVLKILNRREVNIQTIEDPIEYDIEGVNQIQVNSRTNLTFAAGLRSIVRQDPDIVMVGEIRDAETAGIAVNAAMTGHLVLSTLHTNDAATAIPRLLDMEVEPFLVASSVNVIIAQRLVRRICPHCITSSETDLSKVKSLFPEGLYKKYFGKRSGARLFHGKGCGACNNTGFAGRIGIFEVLEVTPAIRELVVRRADAGVIAQKAVAEGMTTMFDDGLRKVVEGVTTVEEVLRVAKAS